MKIINDLIQFEQLIRGVKNVPPHWYKEWTVKRYGKKNKCNVFIETGTYKGDMDYALRDKFDWIGIVEIVPELHEKAKERLSDFTNVHLYCGDSATQLSQMIRDSERDNKEMTPVFFLDGHYSKGETGKGELDTPIISELDSIFDVGVNRGVLLIDDARCFVHSGEFIDYPTIDVLHEEINKRWPKASFSVRNDIIRVVL